MEAINHSCEQEEGEMGKGFILQKVVCVCVCCCSVAKSCPTLCDPMDHSTPGASVLHCFPEFDQMRVHQVGDALQPSHPLCPCLHLKMGETRGCLQAESLQMGSEGTTV